MHGMGTGKMVAGLWARFRETEKFEKAIRLHSYFELSTENPIIVMHDICPQQMQFRNSEILEFVAQLIVAKVGVTRFQK